MKGGGHIHGVDQRSRGWPSLLAQRERRSRSVQEDVRVVGAEDTWLSSSQLDRKHTKWLRW